MTFVASDTRAREITLDRSLEIAIGQSSRGNIIAGNYDVAEQNYRAKRINFYLPEISINGSLPSYTRARSYDFAQGTTDRSLIETRNLGLSSFIRLKQSLITGGDLEVTANLTADDYRRPNYSPAYPLGEFVYEDNRRGYFNFDYEQPLLKPSESRNTLHNRKDDLEIARYARIEEEQALKTEVTESYMGVLRTSLNREIAGLKAEKGHLQSSIDSMKFADGILSEEQLLESTSALLDAELENFEADTEAKEQVRELAMLLDLDVSEPITPVVPSMGEPVEEQARQQLVDNWENTVAIRKAESEYQKSRRAADFAASSHGLTGDLAMSYSFGKEDARKEILDDETRDKLSTNSWGISLNFTYPLWDGGASGAAVSASRHLSEQARMEFEKTKKSARAEIINAVNRLDVSYQRLHIVEKQIELALNRLNIARERFADGQISELTYLESRIFYLETKDRYLDELKNYLINKIELEHKYAG
jgi:outer membrane protein TolC